MWETLMFWRRTPRNYLLLEDASRELAKVWAPEIADIRASVRPISPKNDRSDDSLPETSRINAQRRSGADKKDRIERLSISPVLRELLLNGALSAYLQDETGQLTEVRSEFWAEAPTIEVSEKQRFSGKNVEYYLSGKVIVPRAQIAALIKLASEVTSQQDSSGRAQNQGGAPPKYDTEVFLTEAFRILYESNPAPKTAADLRRRALNAYAEGGHPGGTPSEDWARPKIAKLWRRLRSG
jgi:hypothetical protein